MSLSMRNAASDPEYVYDRHPGVRPCPAGVYRAAALGGGGRNLARPVADRLALHLRLFRRRPAHILAYRSRRTRGPARRPAVVAGLGPERSGHAEARPMTQCNVPSGPPVWQHTGGFLPG